jgi:parallel beta-helix repeat protein
LYVGGIGPGNFTFIQDAIDNASEGDTVFVYGGIYYENLNIKKYGLSLIGEDKEHTIIDGGGKYSVIQIDMDNCYVNINGFSIQNAGGKDINFSGVEIFSTNNNVSGNIIRNNPQTGVWVDNHLNANSNDINDNIIIDNEFGIFLDYTEYNRIFNNYIVNNIVGIEVGHSVLPSNNEITFTKSEPLNSMDYVNYIYRNTITKNEIGLEIDGWTLLEVFENTISENNIGILLHSPYLIRCRFNNIYKNNITNNYYGIYFSVWHERSDVKFNKFYENNFINNNLNLGGDCQFYNKWKRNYWDDWIGLEYRLLRFLPYHIYNKNYKHIDWRPATKPYDIGI